MRALLIGAGLALAGSAHGAMAAGTVPYGSRVGMEATITRMEGIGSANAIIHVRHLPANAKSFCVGYSDDRSRSCVERVLRDTRISDTLSGNCKTGQFTTLYGQTLRFEGESKKREDFEPRYKIVGDDGVLDGSSASGYPTALSQFQALCPDRVPELD